MKKIAVCIPTYGHPQVVEDVLGKCIQDYHALGIDIYYYDSSKDEETYNVIKRYQEMGFENLFYHKISSELGVEKKVELIYEGYGLEKEYDYIWPVKDRSYCPKATLSQIMDAAEEGYDAIFLGVTNMGNGVQVETTTYVDAAAFYRDWGWLSTSLDVIIYNRRSLLDHFNKEEFEKQVIYDYNIYWCPIVLFYNKILEIENLRIRLLRNHEITTCASSLGNSSWTKDTFKIWQEYWIKANMGLPACYDSHKEAVIKEATSLPWILGSTQPLIKLHKEGILTLEVYEQIKEDWTKVSNVPLETVYQIAAGVYDAFHDVDAIKNINNEMIRLLAQCITMVKEDKLPKEQIPFDSIHKYIQNTIIAKKKVTQETYNVMMGSVLDIQKYILREDTQKADVVAAMQMYVTFLIMLLG